MAGLVDSSVELGVCEEGGTPVTPVEPADDVLVLDEIGNSGEELGIELGGAEPELNDTVADDRVDSGPLGNELGPVLTGIDKLFDCEIRLPGNDDVFELELTGGSELD